MSTEKRDPTNSARQRRWRERLRQRLQPISQEEWRLLTEAVVAGLRDYPPSQRRRIAKAMNTVLKAHQVGLRVELGKAEEEIPE